MISIIENTKISQRNLNQGRLSYILLLTIIIFSVWPELRISPSGFEVSFQQGAGSVGGVQGYPRMVELMSLGFLMTSISYALRSVKKFNIAKLALVFLFFISLIRIFHFSQFDVLRSGFIIPLTVFISCLSIPLNTKRCTTFISFIIFAAMISSLAIFLQSLNLIHLPAIEIYDISSQKVGYRYAGLGNSYAYESAYLWIGVSTVLGILFQKLKPKQMLFYLLITVIIFISAIFTGARTGYVAGFITSIYALYKNNLIRNIKNVVVTILIFTIFVGMIFTINKEFLSGGIISTLSGRLQLEDNRLRAWIDGLTVALSSPVIGVGNYQSAASSQGIVTIAHEQNGFIALINYSGILSFILYIFILLKIFQYLTNPHSRFDVLSTALINISLYTMIIYIIFMMTEIMYTSGQIQIIIFIIFGITLNYIRNAKPVENHCPHQRRPRQPTLLLCRCPSTGFGQRCGTGHR